MSTNNMPARIWANGNGMSTRLPDGHRQFIGGWSEDKDRPRAEAFIRADIVERMAVSLEDNLDRFVSAFPAAKDFPTIKEGYAALTSYREASNDKA